MSTPARTASLYLSSCITLLRRSFTLRVARVSLIGGVSLAVMISGCNSTGGGLSSNLPPAGGGGVLSFTSAVMPDGVAGRTYSKVAVTSVETAAQTGYLVSPGVASGTAPLASCTVTAGSLPPGMNPALTVDAKGAGCVISGTPLAADAGSTYQFTIQALDSNSPPRAATQSFMMKVRPEFTVTAPPAIVANALPAGVQGRNYGQIAGNAAQMTVSTTLSATVGNGPPAATSNYCVVSAPGATLALNLVAPGTSNNCILQNSGALTAGSYKVGISVTDSPIVDLETGLQAVPANTITAATNVALNVAAPLHLAANNDAVSAAPANAVQGRAYGTGSGCSGGACLPLTYLASGGLPSVEPADSYLFTGSAGLTSAGITCAGSASSSVAKTTCSGTGAAAGTSSFSVSVDDSGNLATPSGSASGTTGSVSGLSLTVEAPLTLPVSPDPAANPAVQNRDYGMGSGCSGGNCAAPTYTATGGLAPYVFSVPPAAPSAGAAPLGIVCAANGGNTAVSCDGTAGPTAVSSTFTISVADTANASTPAVATPVAVAKTLAVNGALSLTAPTGPFAAVNGRAFGTGTGCTGTGGACQAANFAISGGIGVYAANATITSQPGTWACPLQGTNYACNASSVSNATTSTLTLSASDTASATTPSGTSNTASISLSVGAPLALTPPASVNDAVAGRPYGVGSNCTGGACTGISYTVSGGLGNYGAATLTAGANTFSCSAGPTYTCNKSAITGSGSQTLTMSVSETGNAWTPGATATDTTKSLTIDQPLTLTATIPSPWPTAVRGRTYGEIGTALQFNATNGIPPYVSFTPSNFPDNTFVCSSQATSTSCSSGDVTGAASATPYSPAVTVVDTGNASTPPATTTTDPNSVSTGSLLVNAPLAINAITLPNALQNYPYPTVSTAATLSTIGGLGNNTWIGPGAAPAGQCATPTGTIPTGFALTSSPTSATITGTTSAGSAAYQFQVCVTDTGNSMTPASFALPNTTGNNLAMSVVAPYAVITETTADEIEFYNTSSKSDSAVVSQPVSTGTGSQPYGVAFSPSGRYAYVALSGTNKLAIFDTITNAPIAASPVSLASCTTPHGVAATASYIFIACSVSGNVAVVDATTFAASYIATDSNGSGPEGVATSPDGTRVYVTLSNENKMFVIDSSAAPAALIGTNPFTLSSADGSIPFGIAVAPASCGCGTVAYIAKDASAGADGVEVVSLTADNFSTITDIQTSADGSALPSFVAMTPDNTRAYVTLSNTGQFAVISNGATQQQVAGSPFNLATNTVDPTGVAIPVVSPVPANGFAVFIAQTGANNLALIDNKTTPTADASSPLVLSGTAPALIASTPAPQ
jgi:DNA-binding beta-propeller fold protein YncE